MCDDKRCEAQERDGQSSIRETLQDGTIHRRERGNIAVGEILCMYKERYYMY